MVIDKVKLFWYFGTPVWKSASTEKVLKYFWHKMFEKYNFGKYGFGKYGLGNTVLGNTVSGNTVWEIQFWGKQGFAKYVFGFFQWINCSAVIKMIAKSMTNTKVESVLSHPPWKCGPATNPHVHVGLPVLDLHVHVGLLT